MNQLITIQGVRGFIDENGTAQLNLEDVARGLGFTDNSKGSEYVRWNTVRAYLQSFGFSQEVAKDTFVPENIFYRLAMKAKNEAAEFFQSKVADEILPAIRKTGTYSVPTLTPNEAIALSLKHTAEMMTKVPVLESRIGNLENTMTIDYGQQRSLRKLGNKVVMDLVGGKNSVAYKKFASKAFNELWKHYKNTFNIESYCNTPALEYERGKEVLKAWKPSEELRYAILGANTEQLVSN